MYEIVSAIGAGGMGEVFLATDTRLDRRVALKILPSALSMDDHRRRRFMREARAASGLSHPNVATIYDIGEAGGVSYIAMEYIEGCTLADRIRGPTIAIDDIAEFGSQIADALSAAHEHGVVHRDIKPANVMITSRGQAKVLDFGLAKIESQRQSQRGRRHARGDNKGRHPDGHSCLYEPRTGCRRATRPPN